ncbi:MULTISPECIES: hypothetical protein [unclassified Solwaraspora]|uniref:hypothetical protein n=1 Tax=unclassified Solwaraspora TaxID=2627926 RepID=UPI00248C0B0D|nr:MULTISPECIES: hypothetical protein [unclassified Solwaraspora]WBB94899.1 hypothetical protein O7553_15810 [Solwaraspora sp. WMMA2059]WBC21218.1 hypothetical protein O7543_01565 [Solwaraspora sp. WMMA2080]WJK36703.1 hypothetical protein O7610_10335 [Solwaraspora sp. WMMA2065]
MRILWLHIRNSPIRVAVPILIALDLAVLFLRSNFWIGSWPETGAAAQVPAYLVGILGAGAAAWAAGATNRHGLDEQISTASVRTHRLEAHRLGSTAIILLAPYLTGQAVAFAITARSFPPGVQVWAGYFLLGIFVTLFATAIGWLIGKLFTPVFAAMTASVGFLFLLALLDRAGGFIVVSGHPNAMIDPLGITFRMLTIAALIVGLAWIPTKPSRTRLPVAAALITTILMVIGVAVARPLVVDREPIGSNALCTNGTVTICIWPEHKKYLSSITGISARIDQLPAEFERPERIIQFGVERTVRIDDGVIYEIEEASPHFYILEGSPWSYASDIANAIVTATFPGHSGAACIWDSLTSADQARLSTLNAWLETYLAGNGQPDYQTNAPDHMQEAFAAGRAIANDLRQDQQFDWAQREVGEIHGRYCNKSS